MSELLTEKAKNDPLAKAVFSLVRVMKTDYATAYAKAFGKIEDELYLKRRLYKKLKNIAPALVVDAYENISELNPQFMPTVKQIIIEAISLDKHSKKGAEERKSIDEHMALPKPTIQCNPLEMLKDAHTAAQEKGSGDHDEWMRRKEEARLNNERMIARIHKKYADEKHRCGYGACKKAGSMSHSTNGSEHWYCANHFQMA